MESARSSMKETEHLTIFHEIINSKLPPKEKELNRLSAEAILLVSAGTMTTTWAISVGIFHLLSAPPILQKLRAELEAAIPDPSKTAPLAKLESLPYLKGVVLESLRLSYGVTNRLARIAHEPMKYTNKSSGQTWIIPPGTPCSSISLLLHSDPSIFPQPNEFRPERWIENPRLDKYLFAFSKGTRQCVGMSLANAEIYLMMAKVFRDFGTRECRLDGDKGILELFETDQRDVEPVGDFQIPIVWEGSKGVRMRILKEKS
jgi:cytochrome P450